MIKISQKMISSFYIMEIIVLYFISTVELSKLPDVNIATTWSTENRVLQLRTVVHRNDSPPSYMIHLYNRYRKGRMPYSTANTVRSFYPTPGRLGSDDILVFNLTGVHPSEYVERVDLHLHSKRHVRIAPPFDAAKRRSGLQADILDLSRPERPRIQSIPLSRVASGGWQTLDLTDSVIACLENDGEVHHLVGVVVRGQDRESFADVTKAVSQPFLVLFSEDDDHLQVQELDRKAGRTRREILDNELPDYPMLDNTARAEVQARLKYRPLDTAVPKPEARVVPLADLEKHRKRRRRRRRRKDRRLPQPWGKGWAQDDGPGDEDEDEDDEDGGGEDCQKKKMVVDFSEVGWSDWVIAPKTFDASYCAGECAYPLRKDLHPSNHATLQGLLRFLRGREDVPGLCCVPDALAPVAILFYDQNRNVVLKNFPDMAVVGCACR